MHAIFRICGNESQPGLQLVKELATPLTGVQREGEEDAELPNPSLASSSWQMESFLMGQVLLVLWGTL